MERKTFRVDQLINQSVDTTYEVLVPRAPFLTNTPAGAHASSPTGGKLHAPNLEFFQLLVLNIAIPIVVGVLSRALYDRYVKPRFRSQALLKQADIDQLKTELEKRRIDLEKDVEKIAVEIEAARSKLKNLSRSTDASSAEESGRDPEVMDACQRILAEHGWPESEARADTVVIAERILAIIEAMSGRR